MFIYTFRLTYKRLEYEYYNMNTLMVMFIYKYVNEMI